MIKDTNPDHYKVDNANFIEYMHDPKIGGFGNWMFANGFNSGVWACTNNWISVKDRLPDKEGQYLCWFGKNTVIKGAAIATYLEMWQAFGSLESLETYPNVTHWMPIPEGPKGDD